jgi:hypothetical protein
MCSGFWGSSLKFDLSVPERPGFPANQSLPRLCPERSFSKFREALKPDFGEYSIYIIVANRFPLVVLQNFYQGLNSIVEFLITLTDELSHAHVPAPRVGDWISVVIWIQEQFTS